MRTNENATAPYVVFGWDGNVAGVVAGFDNESEARADAEQRAAGAPEHVDYYYGTQEQLRQKVAELTGAPVEMFADPSTTAPEPPPVTDTRDAEVDE